jgi:NitT/TauT family transport system ATP-binding protein
MDTHIAEDQESAADRLRAAADLRPAAPDRESGAVARRAERLVEVSGLDKIFETREGARVTALSDINVHINVGEFVSVVGPSGCGKSTLLRIVCGLIAPTRGRVTVAGAEVRAPRRDVGVVFQSPVLLPWLTVKDNVLMPLDLRQRRSAESEQRAHTLIEMAGLAGFEAKYPFELSGGMRQRVSICRALICKPSFLAMDEPFGALDAMTREGMNLELLRICRETGATVLFITHSVPEAVLMSDRVVVMTPRPGRVADDITIDLPRPRSLKDYALASFNAYTTRIRELLGAETLG